MLIRNVSRSVLFITRLLLLIGFTRGQFELFNFDTFAEFIGCCGSDSLTFLMFHVVFPTSTTYFRHFDSYWHIMACIFRKIHSIWPNFTLSKC